MSAPVTPDTSSSYRQGFTKLVRIIQVQALAIVMLVGVLHHYVSEVIPQDRYFAETATGGKMQIVGLMDPNVNTQALLFWAQQAAVDVMTFGFNDVDQRFTYSQKYFTPGGWAAFAGQLSQSKMLANVMAYQQFITAIPRSPAQMMAWGWKNGKYVWTVQVPIVMTIRAGNNRTPNNMTIVMTIVKLPTAENPRGIAIDSWTSN